MLFRRKNDIRLNTLNTERNLFSLFPPPIVENLHPVLYGLGLNSEHSKHSWSVDRSVGSMRSYFQISDIHSFYHAMHPYIYVFLPCIYI